MSNVVLGECEQIIGVFDCFECLALLYCRARIGLV